MKTATIRMAGAIPEVLLYDAIGEDPFFGGISAKAFREQLTGLKSAKSINLRINSPGGSITEGTAIYSALKDFKPKVNVFIDGLAASIASYIAMAGDTVTIADNAFFMVHNPWIAVTGDAVELRQKADLLDSAKEMLLTAYAAKSGLPRETISSMMEAETWLAGQEAVDSGFADSVAGTTAMAAHADLSKFNFRNAPKINGPTAEQLADHAERKKFLENLKVGLA